MLMVFRKQVISVFQRKCFEDRMPGFESYSYCLIVLLTLDKLFELSASLLSIKWG